MLKDLKVLNGNLELKFNEYTYEYTVTVEKDIFSLELDYKLAEDTFISIKDNYLDKEENIVYLDVYNIYKSITYTLYVYKELTDEVLGIDNYKKSLEVIEEPRLDIYKVQILCIGIFLTLIIVFSIIFKRKRT